MFGIGLPEFAVIAFIAVLVFGPDKLPELARQAGRLVRRAKGFTDGAREELRSQLGPEYADLELRDLDPRSIVRRHIAEAMEQSDEDDDPRDRRRRDPRSTQQTVAAGAPTPYDDDAT